ncbi:MAG: cob(I)yrinic acid a,c-diamide adenosyltransferase [Deltaproteobacteria bacterium]|nr:cob(I)yrinic acid a,c-diamide adenosyltransferase [Deltaproteobacteria bacterium]
MKIYTKTGDGGETGLFGGARVSKADPRVEAYGDVDELNAQIGVARAVGLDADMDELLDTIQAKLFDVGAELAQAPGSKASAMPHVKEPDVVVLEKAIDTFEQELEPLKTFILPGGCPAAAQLHVGRTVTRRAERRVVALAGQTEVRELIVHYLNRLSDLLFVLARVTNHRAGVADVPWTSGSH